MDPGNKSSASQHHERTNSCSEMLKRIDSLANQLAHNCTEIQDTAWQPGVPELAEQMGNTVSSLQNEISKLRDELTAMDGRHQKVILECDRLRQIVANTGAIAMPPPSRLPASSPEGMSSPSASSAVRAASASVVASAVVTGGATSATGASSASSSRLSSASSTGDSNIGSGNVCDVCMASFKSRQTLLQHRHIHDPAPRFCCQLCGNKFRQQSGLYQHMRVVHRKN